MIPDISFKSIYCHILLMKNYHLCKLPKKREVVGGILGVYLREEALPPTAFPFRPHIKYIFIYVRLPFVQSVCT